MQVAKVCRINVHTVQEEIKWLERHEWLTIARGGGGGGGKKSNRYELSVKPEGLYYIDHRLDDARLCLRSFAYWRI
jgi:hypothetical protein